MREKVQGGGFLHCRRAGHIIKADTRVCVARARNTMYRARWRNTTTCGWRRRRVYVAKFLAKRKQLRQSVRTSAVRNSIDRRPYHAEMKIHGHLPAPFLAFLALAGRPLGPGLHTCSLNDAAGFALARVPSTNDVADCIKTHRGPADVSKCNFTSDGSAHVAELTMAGHLRSPTTRKYTKRFVNTSFKFKQYA